MPSCTFVLKEPNIKDKTLIYLFYRFNNQLLKYSTGQKIEPKYWNQETQRVRESKKIPYASLNSLLLQREQDIDDVYRQVLIEKLVPTSDLLRQRMDERIKKTDLKPNRGLLAFAEELINLSSIKSNIPHKRQTIRLITEFKSSTKCSDTFEAVTMDFYESFINFLQGKDYSLNTIGGHIKNLKFFMNEALERGLTKNIDFKSKKFKKPTEEADTIYLTKAEIENIYSLDYSNNPKLDRVRDLFIIGCYTGLRFSDLFKLKKEHFVDHGNKLKILNEKTGDMVVIPLHPHVKAILKKYEGTPPPSLSNQKMNDYLKEIGEDAELNEKVIVHKTKGGKKIAEVFKKYELITAHTARRSFATNAFLMNVPTISIMKITGHKTERVFLKYIKISQEDNANKLTLHPFFN